MASKVILLALVALCQGDLLAPYPPEIPAPVYGPPEVIEAKSQPEQIITSYQYKVLDTPKLVEELKPYPALRAPAPVYGLPRTEIIEPAVPAPVYGPPEVIEAKSQPEQIITSYQYKVLDTPKVVEELKPYPALKTPAPVYGLPRTEIIEPAIPAPVYGPPEVIEAKSQPEQIITSYQYKVLDAPKVIEELKPYPALKTPAPVYGLPRTEIIKPVIPAPVYGLPRTEIIESTAPIKTEYKYNLPQYEAPVLRNYPAPIPVATAAAKIDLPVYPSPVYGVPKIELPVEQPVLTSYDYSLPKVEILKPEVKLAPYPAPTPILKQLPVPAVPHLEYGPPAL